ncbi:hypothetical protein AN391_01893 [Pseudoalteromonas sp. P1-13-1a]|uniref:hypothetical protein n=1 Tax=Pseudoalteromonas sp. P1-13-1a TaxID=1723756 RepID=UPI0006D67A7B|nr:hypothetical protein [Pseudoalteromonas sp. P1-13-1a]KPZ57306.1 hypothetical protein AN391_01893 [Pseudoalteromonas sp. P1-13-1a]
MSFKLISFCYCIPVLFLNGCDEEVGLFSSSKTPLVAKKENANLPVAAVEKQRLAVEGLIEGVVPSHCKRGETAYINAKMQKVIRNPTANVTYTLKPTDNILSVCVANDNSAITYRYGTEQKIGLEYKATAAQPFGSYYRQIGKIGESILFFNKGNYYYYIINAGGMGSGVTVNVYKNKTLIGEFFSGNEAYNDFVIASNLDLPKSLAKELKPHINTMQ